MNVCVNPSLSGLATHRIASASNHLSSSHRSSGSYVLSYTSQTQFEQLRSWDPCHIVAGAGLYEASMRPRGCTRSCI